MDASPACGLPFALFAFIVCVSLGVVDVQAEAEAEAKARAEAEAKAKVCICMRVSWCDLPVCEYVVPLLLFIFACCCTCYAPTCTWFGCESRLWNAAWFRRCACFYWSSRLFLVIACAVFLYTDVGRGFARFCLPLSIVHGVRVTLTLIPLLFRLEVGPSSLHPLVCSGFARFCLLLSTVHDVRVTLRLSNGCLG